MCFLAMRLGYLSEAETAASLKLITEISKMLTKLRKPHSQPPNP